MIKIIKKIFQKLGIDIRRFNSENVWALQINTILKKFNINLVFDVGANNGQYAQELFDIGYKNKIISFEPLAKAYEKLLINSDKHDNWIIHNRCALGESQKNIEINISENSVSSSLLDILDEHVESAISSRYIGKELIKVDKLDNVFNLYYDNHNCALKIDTQGFEKQVLEGSLKSLDKISLIQCEISLFELYKGGPLLDEIKGFLEELDFSLWALYPAFVSKIDGKTLQIDAIFVKNNLK